MLAIHFRLEFSKQSKAVKCLSPIESQLDLGCLHVFGMQCVWQTLHTMELDFPIFLACVGRWH